MARSPRVRQTAAIAAAVAIAVPLAVRADAIWVADPVTPSSWFTAANWTEGIPATHTWAEISNGGTAQIASGTATTRYLWLGRDSGELGHVVQTGGRFKPGDDVYIGYNGTGSYTLSGSSSSFGEAGNFTGSTTYVGFGNVGTFTHNGGRNYVGGGLTLGYGLGSSGTYRFQAGTIEANDYTGGMITVGYQGLGTFEHSGGDVRAVLGQVSLAVGDLSEGVGIYRMSGGSAQYQNVTLGSSSGIGGWGMFEQSGGTHTSTNLTLGGSVGRGIYRQSGGAHTSSTMMIGATGLYEYSGGTLNAGSIVNDGVFDFAGSDRTLTYDGTLDLTRGAFTSALNASLVGGTNSLLIVGPGQSPLATFGSFSTQGIVHEVGTTLYVPAGETVGGTATLSDLVDVAGWLGNSFTLEGGVRVSGAGLVRATSVSVNDNASGISGGEIESKTLTIGNLAAGTFTQSGGTNNPDFLTLHDGSAYVLSGGTLAVEWGATVRGALDFAGGPGTIRVNHGIVNLGDAHITNASAGHLDAFAGLLILPSGFNASEFGSVTGDGIIHNAGSPLTIPSGKNIWGGGEIDDHVNLNGSIQYWQELPLHLNGGLTVSGGSASLGTNSAITVEDHTSGISAGSITAAALYVGRAGAGTFNNTGGSTTISEVYLGHDAGSSGTFNLTGGNVFGSSDFFVGYSGTGTLNQSTGILGANVYLGYNAGAQGSYTFTGGSTGGNIFAGYSGTGTYTLDSATAVIEFRTLQAGFNAGSQGDVHLNAGTFKGDVYVGNRGSATLVQNGASIGTATNTGSLYVGAEAGSTGTVQLTNGSVSRYRVVVGDGGTGTFVQSGGSVSVGNELALGEDATGNGAYRMQAGLLTSNAATIGSRGIGSFEHLAGTHTVANALVLGELSGGTGTYRIEAGKVSAATLNIGRGGTGTFQHVGGTVAVTGATTIGATASTSSGHYEFSSGNLTTGDVTIAATGRFFHDGGDHSTNNIVIAGGATYRLGGGSLNVAQGLDNLGTFDFTAAPASFNYGGLVNLARGNMLGGAGTSVSGAAGSLIILPAGFNPVTGFASFSTSGLVHNAGSTLSIGAEQSLTLHGNIDDAVDVTGTLAATTGKALNLNKGVIVSGSGSVTLGTSSFATVDDATSGISGGQLTATSLRVGQTGAGTFTQTGGKVTASVAVASPAGTSGIYDLVAGELAASAMNIGSAGNGAFRQSGGTNTLTTLTIGPTGTYEWSGGTLVVNGGFTNQGVFDFTGAANTLALKGVANFAAGMLSNTQDATLTGSGNSLMIFASGYDPAAHFANFSSAGIVHTRGNTLVIPAGRTLSASGTIDDPVDVFGTVSGSTTYRSGLTVRPGGSVTVGVGNFDSNVNVTGGTLNATSSLSIGRTATASLAQSGGTVSTTSFGGISLGGTSTGNGTYTITGGNVTVGVAGGFSSGSISVGSVGRGEFIQRGGSVTINGSSVSGRLSLGGGNATVPGEASGIYRLEAGTLSVAGEWIGSLNNLSGNGRGTMIQTGGTHAVAGELVIRAGTLDFSGGTLSAGSLRMDSDAGALHFGLSPELFAAAPVTVNGRASFDGTFGFDIDPAYFSMLAIGDSFVLLTSNGAINGEFNNATPGSRVSSADGASSFLIHYGPSSDYPANQLVLIVPAASVPEPTTLGVAALAAVFAGGRRRRR